MELLTWNNVSRETMGDNMDDKIKQIYIDNLLSWDDIKTILDDMRNDGIIEKHFDMECITDNLIDMFNDNVETIANDLISLYENNGGII